MVKQTSAFLRNVRRPQIVALGLSVLLAGSLPGYAKAQTVGYGEISAMVVARVSTTLTPRGGALVREIAGGVLVLQNMTLSSNVDSQSLEADLASPADGGALTVSVRCGGGTSRCRLSSGETLHVAVEVSVGGLSPAQVQAALAAPDRFAARVTYRLVRGEGT
jgi:hypothetical protein